MSTPTREIDLREVRPDDPAMLRLVEALRDEVEKRGAHDGAARPDIPLAEATSGCTWSLGTGAPAWPSKSSRSWSVAPRGRDLHAVRLDTNARVVEAVRMYREAGYVEIEDHNLNPRADRWFEKALA